MNKAVPAVIDGKYRVVRRLGQGAMGSVYEAVTDAGQHVAVKVIMLEHASNETLVGRFEREARAVSSIDTPHICKALDAGADAQTGLPYIVMELLDGEDLDQILKRLGALSPNLALRIAAQASLALREAHAARVLHRDIKPANLFLHREGGSRTVKLLDFGVAKVRPEVSRSSAETAGLTRTGSMLGSPLYMSPEQARGFKDIDFRSDIWSLGVVLYRMLAGHAPHGETEQLGDLIVLICTEAPPPLQDVAPWVSPQIASIVHRALRFRPGDRWGSAAEMYAAIHALLPEGEAIHEGMLRPMADAEKALRAPRLDANLSDAPPPRASGQGPGLAGSWGPQTSASGEWGPAASSGAYAQYPAQPGSWAPPGQPPPGSPWGQAPPPGAGPATTSGGVAVGPASSSLALGPSQPSSRTGMMLFAAVCGVALLAGGGFAVYRLGSSAPPGPSAVPAASAPAPDDKPRTVTVVILPAGAAVEVDGVTAALSEGVLEITGAVGSVHKVKVTAGGVEKNARVVISENGAEPPKIELEGAAPSATAKPAGPTPGTGGKAKPKPTGTTPEDLRNKR